MEFKLYTIDKKRGWIPMDKIIRASNIELAKQLVSVMYWGQDIGLEYEQPISIEEYEKEMNFSGC